jgi:hypothetical protein
MLLCHALALIAQVPKKVGTPAPTLTTRTAAQPSPASPQAPGQILTTAQRQALQTMISQHQRIRARFQAPEVTDLDRLTAKVRQTLFGSPLPGNLLSAATRVVSHTIPGLSSEEATSLAEYVLGGIAAQPPAGSAGLTGGATAPGGSAMGAAATRGSQSALLAATKQMQETQMSFNLQYLQLQSQMQNENRSYTAVSNIMKTKHDTVKNSINNIR